MCGIRLLRAVRQPLVQDTLPPSWLAPSLASGTRPFSSTGPVYAKTPGKIKTAKRRGQVREGEQLRRRRISLEQGVVPNDPSRVRQIVDTRVSKEREKYDQLIQHSDLRSAFEVLRHLIGPRELDARAAKALTRLIHHQIRTRNLPKAVLEEMLSLVQHWYKERDLIGDPAVTLSILTSFRDLGKIEAAAKFWDWARRQQSASRPESFSGHDMHKISSQRSSADYTNLNVYGAALDILAMAGRSLEETESVYLEGIRRYAVGFNEYHLAPNAWLQEPHKHTKIRGASSGLLAGLMRSRFLHGKVAPGYLNYDTILRLHATQMSLSTLVMATGERPFSEVIQLVCMHLRSGSRVSVGVLTTCLQHLTIWASAASDTTIKSGALEVAFTLIRLAYASGSPLHVGHLNLTLRAVMNSIHDTEDDALQMIHISLMLDVCQLFSALGVSIESSTVRLVDSIAVAQQSNKLMALSNVLTHSSSQIVQDSQSEQDVLDGLLSAYAALGMTSSVQSLWKTFEDRASEGNVWSNYPRMLAMAAVVAKRSLRNDEAVTAATEFLRQQLDQRKHEESKADYLRTETWASFEAALDYETSSAANYSTRFDSPEREAHSRMLQDCRASVAKLRTLFDNNQLHDLDTVPSGPISILPRPSTPDDWQRELYNELVLGKLPGSETSMENPQEQVASISSCESPDSQDTAENESSSKEIIDMSPTCIPLAKLRYQNWCDMNYVLIEAQAFEDLLSKKVDEAIEAETNVPQTRNVHGVKPKELPGVLQRQRELYLEVRSVVQPTFESRSAWQERVRELRKGIEPPPDV